MYPAEFEYYAPHDLSEALDMLGKNPEAHILAGGQSILPMMKNRRVAVKNLVDISGLKELDYIKKDGDTLRIGALATIAELGRNHTVALNLPIVKDAALEIADPLVRNMGTLGGNLCHSDPVNDMPAVMLALGSTMNVAGKEGERDISAAEFFVSPFKTSLGNGEILREISIPLSSERHGNAYVKLKKDSGGFSIAGVACSLFVSDDGSISNAAICLTAAGTTALRAEEAQSELMGKNLSDAVIQRVADIAVSESDFASDLRGSKEYKRKVLRILVRDALGISYERAKRAKQ